MAAANAKAKLAKDEASKAAAEAAAKKAELDRQHAEAIAKLAEKRRKEADAEMAKFDALRVTRDAAAKAVMKANAHVRTFDFEGVAKHMKNANQVDIFRQCVTTPGIAKMVSVEDQEGLAKKLVQSAKTSKLEFTGQYIRDHIGSLSGAAKHVEHRMSAEELKAQEKADAILAIENRFKEATRHGEQLIWKLKDVQDLVRDHGIRTYTVPADFRNVLEQLTKAATRLGSHF